MARQATGVQVPRKKPEPSGSYLSLDERLWVADLRLAADGVRAIATAIGRSRATVSRELRRNGCRSTHSSNDGVALKYRANANASRLIAHLAPDQFKPACESDCLEKIGVEPATYRG